MLISSLHIDEKLEDLKLDHYSHLREKSNVLLVLTSDNRVGEADEIPRWQTVEHALQHIGNLGEDMGYSFFVTVT